MKLAAQAPVEGAGKPLQEVTVVSGRADQFNTGSKVEQVDSLMMVAYRHQSLADLLSSQSQLFIKTYGPGSLASSSFRGADAEHTAVLWNGFNLQSPMYGQVDFSLLQADMTDELKLQYGSNGALFGSGAIGGIVHMANRPQFASGLHASVNVQVGSFANNKQSLSLGCGAKRYYTSLRVMNQEAKNDFSYHNIFLPGAPEVRQVNASFRQQGVMNDHYFILSSAQQLNVRVWYQESVRQIPPPMSVPVSRATQEDKTFRASSEWSMQRTRAAYFVRTAWFDERLVYTDSISGLLSHNCAQTNISEAETRLRLSDRQSVNIGLNNTYVTATADGYGGRVQQNRSSVFASYKITNAARTLQACASLREELFNAAWLPLIPSLGAEWTLSKHIRLSGTAGKSYRVPTLNQRFWKPGGNPDLKPESGWSEELSVQFTERLSAASCTLMLTGFNRMIDNWIQWLPDTTGYWTPSNIKRVWSRGIEAELKIVLPAGAWSVVYTGRANYILSTNDLLYNGSNTDASLDKQLIYVPRLNYMNQLSVLRKGFFISFNQTYTGIRFIQTDGNDWLNYYLLGNVTAGKDLVIRRFTIALNAQVNNVWNETYQVIKDRPMPGRNYLFGLTIKI